MALPAIQGTGFQFRRILGYFPQDISLAFAYGSGVFRQSGTPQNDAGNKMLDFVFAVDDPVTWHTMNIIQNRSHYSFLKFLGPKHIAAVQNNYGAGIYYNTLVPCDGRVSMWHLGTAPPLCSELACIKYGLVQGVAHETLAGSDLLALEGRCYSAGTAVFTIFRVSCHSESERSFPCHMTELWAILMFQVKILTQRDEGRLHTALSTNLKSALTAAFLMLPESFSEEELYLQIAGLSYAGDFRMIIGEDKDKVLNIVKPNVPHFQKLYAPILQDCPLAVYKAKQGRVEVDKSPEGQYQQLMALPKKLQQNMAALVDPPGKNRDVEEILLQVAQDPDCGNVVQQALYGIVRSSSVSQSAKGILTAGVRKTAQYSSKKLYKMLRSLRKGKL
ncbi:phosphatidate cytidylyltransferase, mitochondrial [Xenopus tropicalis]|uniref:Phosphatidate cytidylyltransferase, mitochondrial n=1 Tax=Xenopus tropicalis TaxID=8364 RepID=A0A8J1JKQ9_XENTR|nr:phosphatidate cytidylyltransferase, mitochondrial [Xenopus tropicalis]